MEEILKTFDLSVVDGYMIPAVAILFVLFWKILEKVLFTPYMDLLEARERATIGTEKEAEEAQLKANVGQREYESKIQDARRAAMEKKLNVIASAKNEVSNILSGATEEAEKLILAARNQLKKQSEMARTEAISTAESLANDLVSKLKQPPATVKSLMN